MPDLLPEMLRRTVATRGERPAVVESGATLSYNDLDSRSDEVAATLRSMGVRPGARIGIFRRKSAQTVACIHGVLKAGCAYVPVDIRAGSNRLAAILEDADLAALLIERRLMPRLQALGSRGLAPSLAHGTAHGEVILLSDGTRHRDGRSVGSSATTPAYILYTSGSTGSPKGVQHTHASALAFVSWAATAFGVMDSDRLSCHAPLHFDLTTFDLFVAAMTGACVVLITDEVALFPGQVASVLETEEISVWYSVPFALTQLLRHGGLARRRPALREVIFAGERFPPAQLRDLAAVIPDARLTNLFGPTETNVCTCHHLSRSDVSSDEFAPIGAPCPYATTVIVDENGDDVPPGQIGELLVGGASVMSGYLNRPALNEAVFVTRSQNGKSGRFFRTGDLVTAPAAAPMRFHGRADRQVKVRGFRVELDEVEAALLACRGVRVAAAWVESDENGVPEVRAAVERDHAATVAAGTLVSELRGHLPQGAVPTRVAVLDELPRTGNGKVEYAALEEALRQSEVLTRDSGSAS